MISPLRSPLLVRAAAPVLASTTQLRQLSDLHRQMLVAWLEGQPMPDALLADVADGSG